MGMGFGFGFGLFEVIFGLFFVLFLVMFVTILAKGIGTWHKNNQSPRLTVEAELVAKRMDVSHHHHHAGAGSHHHVSTSTWYYLTFQVESGDRMEFSVSGAEYGMLIEGDRGRLSFQGTRYLDFERDI